MVGETSTPYLPLHACPLLMDEPGGAVVSIFQRKRLRIADFESKEQLQAKLGQCIREWNQHGHPFNWFTKSVAKGMAEVPAMAA
jgi:hypothetical protein